MLLFFQVSLLSILISLFTAAYFTALDVKRH